MIIKTLHSWSTLLITVLVAYIIPVDLCRRLGWADKTGIISFAFHQEPGAEMLRLLAKVTQLVGVELALGSRSSDL